MFSTAQSSRSCAGQPEEVLDKYEKFIPPKNKEGGKKKKEACIQNLVLQSYVASRIRAGHVKVSGQPMIYAFLFEKLINIHLLTLLLYTALH